jgi:acyl-CoA hydrolase
MSPPVRFEDPEALAQAVIDRVGRRIVLALPLGLGKANHVANALFARAAADPSISLRIFTALTLEKPRASSELEARFLNPVIDRLFGGYPDLSYAAPMRAGALPANIEVDEFFFQAGTRLNSPAGQRSYISANYTHAYRYLLDQGFNVLAQLVAKRGDARYSLSCNTDLTLDLLAARRAGRVDFLMVGQVNDELPFMPGDGELPAEVFSHVLDSPATQFPLFAPPKEPVADAHYAMGFHVAALVPDGGTLQIGIGSTGDAVAQALIVRHRQPTAFRETVDGLSPLEGRAQGPQRHFDRFETGLYACTEMFVDSLLDLIDAGVVKREVEGAILHGGFFLGPKRFYAALRDRPSAELERLRMTAISFINQLYGDEDAKRAARVGGRFVNAAMMATALGAVVSDGLEDGRVVSGVGGQYNFVAQAFALEDARSIITLNSVRGPGRKAQSNIRWSYGHTTIPRHLRDIVVTEYGVADLRGKTDEQVIAAMLAVTDSRFQDELMRQAKAAGKLKPGYEIPAARRQNTPEAVARALQPAKDAGLAPTFPFGTDFDAVEQSLMPVLQSLEAAQAAPAELARLLLGGLGGRASPVADAGLRRMGLAAPKSIKDRAYAALVRGAYAARADASRP